MAVARGVVAVTVAVACVAALVVGDGVGGERGDTARQWPAEHRGPRLQYWGLTASGDRFQVTLDAGASAPRIAAALPAGLGEQGLVLAARARPVGARVKGAPGPPPPPPPGGFVCSRFVSATRLDASIHYLGGTVNQVCSGTFIEHWVEYRVERSSVLGWRTYKGSEPTPAVTAPSESWPVGARCGSGGGTYDYRITTIGHARASNGADIIDSDEVDGQPGQFDCGTG
jgi:hypothetical protein